MDRIFQKSDSRNTADQTLLTNTCIEIKTEISSNPVINAKTIKKIFKPDNTSDVGINMKESDITANNIELQNTDESDIL